MSVGAGDFLLMCCGSPAACPANTSGLAALQEPPTTPWSPDLKRRLLHRVDGEEMIKPTHCH